VYLSNSAIQSLVHSGHYALVLLELSQAIASAYFTMQLTIADIVDTYSVIELNNRSQLER
jgi:hypothetical protein